LHNMSMCNKLYLAIQCIERGEMTMTNPIKAYLTIRKQKALEKHADMLAQIAWCTKNIKQLYVRIDAVETELAALKRELAK